MLDTYVRLLETAAEQEDPKVADLAVEKLVAHLESSGQTDLLPLIARELRKIAARRYALSPSVEVAHQKEAKEALATAKKTGIVTEKAVVNASLVSGWRAHGGGQLIDRSGKRALLDIYEQIIA